ncbi:MAG: hypothetical protein AB8F34_06880 [Akkermansiaceae bacterium]
MHIHRNRADNCVMARIMRHGKMYQKNFTVRKYGSWKAAEAEGRNWITKQKKTLPPSRMNEEGRMTNRNQSGVVGVNLARNVRKKDGKEYEYWKWIAKWPKCPLRGGLGWTISEDLSDDDAFALAYLAREMRTVSRRKLRAQLELIYGLPEHKAIMAEKQLELI